MIIISSAGYRFVTLSVREMNPSAQIVARAEQASTQDKLRKAGASRVVCPKIIGASRVTDVVLRPAVVDFVEMAHKGIDLEMDQLVVSPGSPLAGKTLPELSLPRRVGVQVVAIRRATGQAVYHPTSELRLTEGDVLILVGRKGAAAAVQKLQAEGGGRAQEP